MLNHAGSEGGAIFVNGSALTCGDSRTCHLSISQSTFHNNTASIFGGGASIFGDGLAVTVSSSQFVNNTAGTFSPASGLVGGGGALVVYGSSLPGSSQSSLLVTATNFTSNSGAYFSGALYTGVADVSLKGCGFNDNTHMFAPYNIVGSAMYVDSVMALSVDTSSFWDNSGMLVANDGPFAYFAFYRQPIFSNYVLVPCCLCSNFLFWSILSFQVPSQ